MARVEASLIALAMHALYSLLCASDLQKYIKKYNNNFLFHPPKSGKIKSATIKNNGERGNGGNEE